MFVEIKQTLKDFRVDFDVYFHEDDLHRSGAVQKAIERITALGNTYEQDGALWLASEKFGDDKDRVIVRSNGKPAYLSGDLAYYLDKRERGFDRCLILLGADHHGYVGRMMAMCAAFGDTPGKNLELIIGQMVNLLSHGSVVRMGKRTGNIVTLDDLVDSIGVDAARYALVRNSLDVNLDIDVDLWARATNENPVFYVQYAHARVSSILRNAADLGLAGEATHVGLLTHDREGDLLRALAEFPRVVATATELREPHRIARYLEETAGAYHRFYDSCRVLPMGDEEPGDLHRRAAAARRRHPGRDGQRARAARGLGTRADVGRVPSHEAGWAHADGALKGPSWLREPTDTNRLVPALWSRTAHKRDGDLVVGGVALADLAAEHMTPAYVLDEADFRSRARAFKEAFAAYDVFYAGKAFLCTTVARWIAEEGLLLDVCSPGELTVALAAGFDPARIGYHGNNKSHPELRRAVVAGVGRIIVDSFAEIERLDAITRELASTGSTDAR